MKIPFDWLNEYVKVNTSAKEVARLLTVVGHALDKPIFVQGGQEVMDLEERGNRADVMGIVGIARDLAAILDQNLIEPETLSLPPVKNIDFPVKISVESKNVKRWTAVYFRNVKVQPSSEWIAKRLLAYGIEPKNNIVDITNYVMIELGMPSHAFDTDTFDQIILRQANEGETLKTFDGGVLTFSKEDLVAASTTKPLTLTTAVGGEETGISNSTTNVLIEAGLYDQPTARRSALRHNVRNETSARLGRYLHPNFCELALARILYLLKNEYSLTPEPIGYDYYPDKEDEKEVVLTPARLNLVAGEHIDLKHAKVILEKLGFLIEGNHQGNLVVRVPYFRTDISMEDDVIEEVLRIRGYDQIPTVLASNPAPKRLIFPDMESEDAMKNIAVRLGYNEVSGLQILDKDQLISSGIVDTRGQLLDKFFGTGHVVSLENSWNQELNTMRVSLFFSLLNYYKTYTKHRIKDVRLLECGKVYLKTEGNGENEYLEDKRIAFLTNSSFETLKSHVATALSLFGVNEVTFQKVESKLLKDNVSASINANGRQVGIIGEVKTSVLAQEKVSQVTCYCELKTSDLTAVQTSTFIKPVTKIQNWVSLDVTIEAVSTKPAAEVLSEAIKLAGQEIEVTFEGEYANDELKAKNLKKITLSLSKAGQDNSSLKELAEKISHNEGKKG